MNNEHLSKLVDDLALARVASDLLTAPGNIAIQSARVEQARARRDEARENLKLAEANAEASAWMADNGAKLLADAKKAQTRAAVLSNPDVQATQKELAAADSAYQQSQIDVELWQNKLAAARSLASLAAGLFNYLS